MCKGLDCPVKEKCKRYFSKPSFNQSYFLDAPFEIKEGVFKCELFWNDNQDSIINQLNEILNK